MYKLIGIAVAAIPIVLFLRAIFIRRAKQRSQALSDFKKQIDVLVSLILIAARRAASSPTGDVTPPPDCFGGWKPMTFTTDQP